MIKKKMTTYGRITNKAMKVILVNGTKLNKTDKFIFFTLIVKQGSSSTAHIANELLADISGLNVRTIQRSVKRLLDLGLVTRLKKGIYRVHKDFMYKRGSGFGFVNWDLMRSDLSVDAKLLFVVNKVAAGNHDRQGFYGVNNIMYYAAIGRESYTNAMKELNEANILSESQNYHTDKNGNVRRKKNDKIFLSEQKFRLTYSRYDGCFNQGNYPSKNHVATKEDNTRRQLETLVNDIPGLNLQEPLSRTLSTIPKNTAEYFSGESVGKREADFNRENSLSENANIYNNYRSLVDKDFDLNLLANYHFGTLVKIAKLYRKICMATSNNHWRMSIEDFKKLYDFVTDFEPYKDQGFSPDDYLTFIQEELIPSGRVGNSFSYWMSEGLQQAYIGHLNAEVCGLEFELDS